MGTRRLSRWKGVDNKNPGRARECETVADLLISLPMVPKLVLHSYSMIDWQAIP